MCYLRVFRDLNNNCIIDVSSDSVRAECKRVLRSECDEFDIGRKRGSRGGGGGSGSGRVRWGTVLSRNKDREGKNGNRQQLHL